MSLRNARYQHWEGTHLGIWARRWAITNNGLKACFQTKGTRQIITASWILCLVQVAILFIIGQLLVADSIVVEWIGNLNPQLQGIAQGLTQWLEQHPEVSVNTTYNLLFYYYSYVLSGTSLVLVTIAIPLLLTRDLSSNAILVYSSKAVSRFDYLLGKFGTVFGLMTAAWLAPLCVSWFAGNLLSPKWHFFWHSRIAFAHMFFSVTVSMAIISILALGVSAISSNTRSTGAAWVAIWLLGNALVPISFQTKPWLKFFCFTYDLRQLSLAVFNLRADLELASQQIPGFGFLLANAGQRRRRNVETVFSEPEIAGALVGLGIMVIIAVVLVRRKANPE